LTWPKYSGHRFPKHRQSNCIHVPLYNFFVADLNMRRTNFSLNNPKRVSIVGKVMGTALAKGESKGC